MAELVPPSAPARPHAVVTPDGTERNDPYHWLRDDDHKDGEVTAYLHAENDYAEAILKKNAKLEDRLIGEMGGRVPRIETTPPAPSESLQYWYGTRRGPGQDYFDYVRRPAAQVPSLPQGAPRDPLSYGPDLKAADQLVLDVNKLAKKYKYCDVQSVKPSPNGRYVAFTVDTVGNEMYELVVQEVGNGGKRVKIVGEKAPTKAFPFGGLPGCASHVEWAPDSSAVFSLLLTPKTQEAYKLVRVKLLTGGTAGRGDEEPELLLQDDKEGAILELLTPTSCGRFLPVSRRSEGYTTLLALTLKRMSTGPVTQPTRGVPREVKLYGKDPWVVIAPASDEFDVLRADHLFTTGSKETFAVLMDSDEYPDGHVVAITDGNAKRRVVLVPGKKGRQVVDILVAATCGSTTNATSNSTSTGSGYLVVHVLERMAASLQTYDISGVRRALGQVRAARRLQRRQHRRILAGAADADARQKGEEDEGAIVSGGEDDDDSSEEEQQPEVQQQGADGGEDKGRPAVRDRKLRVANVQAAAAAPAKDLVPQLWSYSPGAHISSLHLDHSCWPGSLPYVRLSYSCTTTPMTTVDLDLSANKAFLREVEKIPGYDQADYKSETLWAKSYDGTEVPVTVAGRTDAWPTAPGGNPLPCIVQLYGAYGRKLLPDFIPGDLAFMDGAPAPKSGSGSGSESDAANGPGPVLMVLAHVRGGGELGAYWHMEGKHLRKNNTAADAEAVVQALVDKGYCRPGAVAIWGRSAGGLAAGMTLQRCPPGTFRVGLLDVPFLDVLGAMTDPSLPLTIKERPEWGDPTKYQEDYDYILSYTPYEHVDVLARQTPALLATCSLNDPRVPYWGPARFTARLRAAITVAAGAANGNDTSGNGNGTAAAGGPVMLLTEMGAGGHFSASGASGRLAERAMRGAFLLSELRRALTALRPANQSSTNRNGAKP